MNIKDKTKAFTLIEILLVVVIMGALAAMVVPRLTGRSDKAREQIAKAAVTSLIPDALRLYELDNGMFPTTEQGLKALIVQPTTAPIPKNWNGPYVEGKKCLDPWGRVYMYRNPSTHGMDFDLYSLGKSGEDDDFNVVNWE